ncbi:hypothetical protein ACO0QE_003285 [Hanseniaspora vineae]
MLPPLKTQNSWNPTSAFQNYPQGSSAQVFSNQQTQDGINRNASPVQTGSTTSGTTNTTNTTAASGSGKQGKNEQNYPYQNVQQGIPPQYHQYHLQQKSQQQ